MMLKDHMGSSGDQHFALWVQFGDFEAFDFTPARSAAVRGDGFTAILPTSHPHNSSSFAPFPTLIVDPEGNMMRSVDVYSLYIVYASILDRT